MFAFRKKKNNLKIIISERQIENHINLISFKGNGVTQIIWMKLEKISNINLQFLRKF